MEKRFKLFELDRNGKFMRVFVESNNVLTAFVLEVRQAFLEQQTKFLYNFLVENDAAIICLSFFWVFQMCRSFHLGEYLFSMALHTLAQHVIVDKV